ncbi:MAG: hypothetical protein CV089_09480 [Nitrospira sp. WS110]|nr:hypothetical protein [Nitrospira sp. WS110]
MTTIRTIATAERSNSLRVLTSRYEVLTARQLIEAYSSKEKYTYLGNTVERIGSTITVKNQSGEATSIEIGNTKLTPEQQETALDKIWEGIKQFFQEHEADIKSGNIKAADIGGAVYGITATLIVAFLLPIAIAGPWAKIIAGPFIALASQKGRYWGASVDEVVKLLKGKSDLKIQEIAGVLATVYITATYLPIVELAGVDAWNLTVAVGKKLGGAAADILEDIPVVGDLVEGIGEIVDDLF